ncbi:type IV secretion system protein [Neoehrlichia mikurensis]|uniref:Type IV secretion system protein n=1 Tax=Neoehrlichia mikurensis TaxID=89586 RepID=A0A9Q9F3M0_9RICK|nr:type IV secretion system protein [Neoehrlichia mikurensis]QXK91862.1 type IV secretion system protein [Neoehrlichia mikurensis]QXK93075.1 type IV secretion system protein [Neoehrlichia mikurensis]QXK93555.1 type IV secretion system protein [Neoehrlichia mikurensis]UTO55489.1 type IV secretion system protein [Neoehrlichia mikurensis]UTO56411.1 type IV secretion system protein [Neoehrlichia mikurensis]
MLKIAVLIFIFLLSGCGYHGCVSQNDVFFDIVKTIIPTKLRQDDSKQSILWVKSDAVLTKGSNIELRISHVGLDFCKDNSIDVKVVPDYKSNNSEIVIPIDFPYNVMRGEKINFYLKPSIAGDITKEICESGCDDKICVIDEELCKEKRIDTKYSVNVNAENGVFSNMLYPVNDQGVALPYWIDNYPVYTIFDGMSDNIKIGSDNSRNDSLLKDDLWYICASKENISKEIERLNNLSNGIGNKVVRDAKSFVEEHYKLIFNKYRKIYTAYSVNEMCGNIYSLFSDIVNKYYFITLMSNTVQDNISRFDVLPLVKLKVNGKVIHNNKHFDSKIVTKFPNIKEYLLINYSYEFVDDIIFYDVNYDMLTPKLKSLNTISLVVDNQYQFNGENKKLGGSYDLKIVKDCSAHIENSLYYVISKDIPNIYPGDQGSTKLDFLHSNIINIPIDRPGDLYYAVRDNGDGYHNNTGYFEIKAVIPKTIPKIISYVINWVKDQVYMALYSTDKHNANSTIRIIYDNITSNGSFIKTVNALLTLYLLISVLFFFIGFSRLSLFDIVVSVIKISIVIYVLRPESWVFFKDHLFDLFINAPIELIRIFTGNAGGDFEFLDSLLYRFAFSQTWMQIFSLLFAGPVGWLSVFLILWGLITLMWCILISVITYLISILSIGLLLCIAPFFIICILFRRTKAIFDAWIKALLQTSVQPIIIFASLALLVQAIHSIVYNMLNFQVCDACVFNVTLTHGVTFCLLEFLLPIGFSPVSSFSENIRDAVNNDSVLFIGIPSALNNIIMFVIFSHAMKSFISIAGEMCTSIFGSFANLSSVADVATESFLSSFGGGRTYGMNIDRYKMSREMYNRGNDGNRDDGAFSQLSPVSRNIKRPNSAIQIPEKPPSSFN